MLGRAEIKTIMYSRENLMMIEKAGLLMGCGIQPGWQSNL